MVVPLNLNEDHSKRHQHKFSHLQTFKSTNDITNDIEEALHIKIDDDGGGIINKDIIEAADGVNSHQALPNHNDDVQSDNTRTSRRTGSHKRQTIDTVILTVESASSCTCILLPHGDKRTYWDLYICVLLLYVGTFVPYRVSFLSDLSGIMEAVEIFVDISFGIDIILNFITGK